MVEMEEERLRMREHVMNEVFKLLSRLYFHETVFLPIPVNRILSSTVLTLSINSNIYNRFLLIKLFAPVALTGGF